METATETTQAPEIVAEAQTQETSVEAQFDPNTIDPKVKEYFESQEKEKYKDYENFKNESSQFRQITGDQRFQKWYQELQNPTTPTPKFEITPDEHTAALADPVKMQELVLRAADFHSKSNLAPQLQQARAEIEFFKAQSDLSQIVNKYPEFKELDKQGLIEPVLRKYPGISFVDAMNLAKAQSGWIDKKVDEKARAQVQTQKKAITEKGGNSSQTKGKKAFANRTEAMEYVYREAQNGREVDSDDIEIS